MSALAIVKSDPCLHENYTVTEIAEKSWRLSMQRGAIEMCDWIIKMQDLLLLMNRCKHCNQTFVR